jgi:hypothetical protein
MAEISAPPPPPPPAQVFATIDFSQPTVRASGASFDSGMGMGYNARYGNCWMLNTAAANYAFFVTFDRSGTPGNVLLALTDCTSSDGSSAGYSPINIYVNGNSIVQNFDPAKAHGGSTDFVLDEFLLPASALVAGSNQLMITGTNRGQTNYWIRLLQLKQ